MIYQIILPSIYPPYTDACLATMHPDLVSNTLVWDNTKVNIGVAASWNKGIEKMKERNADWIIFLSASMRFNKGGLDLIEQLQTTELMVAEAEGHQFHLMSIRGEVIEKAGTFDENFFAYYEDTDYGQRIRNSFDHRFRWAKIKVDCYCVGNAHGVNLAGVKIDVSKNEQYYIRKWGGLPGQQTYSYPFNNPFNEQSFWIKE